MMKLCIWSILILLGWGGFSDLPARTIKVAQTDSADVQDILIAIAMASNGDTIRVAPGTYDYFGFGIDKSVALIGAGPDSTIIRYGWELTAGVSAQDVTIEGFTFHFDSDGRSGGAQVSGMLVTDCSPLFRGNRFTGAFYAFDLRGDAQPTIQYNEILTRRGVRMIENPHDIDARFNWWDSDARATIQEKIWDGQDEDGLGVVMFDPWLSAPGGALRTTVRHLSWGALKRIQALNRNR